MKTKTLLKRLSKIALELRHLEDKLNSGIQARRDLEDLIQKIELEEKLPVVKVAK